MKNRQQLTRSSLGPSSNQRSFWRLSTIQKKNIELAMQAGQWGTNKGIGLTNLQVGDKVVFYVSGWRTDAGYWGTATVTSEPFIGRQRIWHDALYPVRFRLQADSPLRGTPVKSQLVLSTLKQSRLTFLRYTGVVRLTEAEYQVMLTLLQAELTS